MTVGASSNGFALIVSTGVGLVELIEKAVTHYPDLIRVLEMFREFTGNRWTHQEALDAFRAAADVEARVDRAWDLQSLDERGGLGRNYRDITIRLVHNVALSYWASSSLLARITSGKSGFRNYGVFYDDHEMKLSADEETLLHQIYTACRRIPFIDKLHTANFAVMWLSS